jgi:hypothetical protein
VQAEAGGGDFYLGEIVGPRCCQALRLFWREADFNACGQFDHDPVPRRIITCAGRLWAAKALFAARRGGFKAGLVEGIIHECASMRRAK